MRNEVDLLLVEVEANGCIEIRDGVFLYTQEQIISEQLNWDDKDAAKHLDFTKVPYWITTDDGNIHPVYTSAELKEYITSE